MAPYGRVRRLVNERTKTRLFVQHQPRFRKFAALRVDVIPDDSQGLRRSELETILAAFSPCRLVIVEFALDLSCKKKMNARFIRRHFRAGKARMRPTRRFPKAAWFGAPKSEQFWRFYPKPAIGGNRLEVQWNRGAIKKYGLDNLDAWSRFPEIVGKHGKFYEVDWARLAAFIKRHFRHDPDAVLSKARGMRGNLDRLVRFLRQVGVSNPTRFLVPMSVNEVISRALSLWQREWEKNDK